MKNETQLISEFGTTQTILLKWFWQFSVKSSIFLLVIAMVFMAIEGSMMGLLSYSVKILFDDVFLSGAAQDILNVGAIIFLIFSTRAASGFFQRSIVSFVGQKILAQLQSQLVFHLLKLDSKFFTH